MWWLIVLFLVVLISQKTIEGFGRGRGIGRGRYVGSGRYIGRGPAYVGGVSVNVNETYDYPWIRFLNYFRTIS